MLKTVSPVNVKQELNASGSAPIYAARAWVNFNGTGAIAIRGSGNVSSITDNGGVGDYTVNFTTAMQDANYAITYAAKTSGSGTGPFVSIEGQSASSFNVLFRNQSEGNVDVSTACFAVFR